MALIFFIALVLRVIPAITRNIIFDEAFTVVFINSMHSLSQMIWADPGVPPLQYLLVRLLSVFSTNLLWIRLPSVIFSMASLAIAFYWMKKYSKRVALIVLILLSFSSYILSFAWQSYVYSQLLFLSLLATYLLFQLLYGNVRWFHTMLLLFACVSLLAFFTHYSFVWTFIGYCLIVAYETLLVFMKRKKYTHRLKDLLFGMVLVIVPIVIYIPSLNSRMAQALSNINWMRSVGLYDIGEASISLLGYFDPFGFDLANPYYSSIGFSLGVSILILLTIVTCRFSRKSTFKELNLFVAVILLATILCPLLYSLIISQSVYAIRAMQVGAVLITFQVALIMDKIYSLELLGKILVIVFILASATVSWKYTRNFAPLLQQQDVAKYYAKWLKDHSGSELNINLFFVNEFSPYPYIDDEMNNVVFDYYWNEYKKQKKVPDYHMVTLEDFENGLTDYYLLTMRSDGDMTIEEIPCVDPKFLYTYMDTTSLKLVKCGG